MKLGFFTLNEIHLATIIAFVLNYAVVIVLLVSIISLTKQNKIPSLSSLSYLGSQKFYKTAILSCFIALAGLPPVSTFFIKSIISLCIANTELIYLCFFIALNLASLVFYMSGSRYFLSAKKKLALFTGLGQPHVRAEAASLFVVMQVYLHTSSIAMDSLITILVYYLV